MAGGKGKKGLKPEELALWAKVARSVEPLPGRQPPKPPAAPTQAPAALGRAERRKAAGATSTNKAARQPPALPTVSHAGRPTPPARPPAGGTLDRRTRQRMLRGQIAIEARLDLHGFGVEEAHLRLRAFLLNARQRGLRTVLVITGKGGDSALSRHTLHGYDFHHAPERRGKLRAMLPRWLAEAGLAEHVAGWQPAHPKHGGGGAFYIRLRRPGR